MHYFVFFIFISVQVKFFDFLNKAQIKAAKQISTALNKAAAATGGADGESAVLLSSAYFGLVVHTSNNERNCDITTYCMFLSVAGATESRENFFHVIQAAKEAGIQESDAVNIWV